MPANFAVCEISDRSMQDNCNEPMELGRWIAQVAAAGFFRAFPDRFERWWERCFLPTTLDAGIVVIGNEWWNWTSCLFAVFCWNTVTLCFYKLINPDKSLQFNSSDWWTWTTSTDYIGLGVQTFAPSLLKPYETHVKEYDSWHNFGLGTQICPDSFDMLGRTGPTDKPSDYVECGCPCKKLHMRSRGHRFSNVLWCINVYQCVVFVWCLASFQRWEKHQVINHRADDERQGLTFLHDPEEPAAEVITPPWSSLSRDFFRSWPAYTTSARIFLKTSQFGLKALDPKCPKCKWLSDLSHSNVQTFSRLNLEFSQ